MTIDYEEDSKPEISTDDLKNITMMAADVQQQEKGVSVIEEKLKAAKAELRKVQEIRLPEAMKNCGMETFVTTDGLKVSIKETMTASIAAKNKPDAAKWLLANELGALVKEDVTIGFDNGNNEGVQDLVNLLTENGISNIKTSESMNTSTVKSAIKELLAQGKEVPLELFGVYFIRKATVK